MRIKDKVIEILDPTRVLAVWSVARLKKGFETIVVVVVLVVSFHVMREQEGLHSLLVPLAQYALHLVIELIFEFFRSFLIFGTGAAAAVGSCVGVGGSGFCLVFRVVLHFFCVCMWYVYFVITMMK